MIEAAVSLVVFNGRALVLRRPPIDRRFPDQWCLPGGQLEPGESPQDAALRECLEETGLSITLLERVASRQVDVHGTPIRIHPFVARTDSEIVRLSEEHTEARWLAREQAAQAETLLPSGLAGVVTAMLLARFADSGALK